MCYLSYVKNCVTFLRKIISRIKQYLASNKIEDQFKSEPRKNQFKGLCTKINLMSRGGITLQIVLDDSLESISDQDLYHLGASTLYPNQKFRIKAHIVPTRNECILIKSSTVFKMHPYLVRFNLWNAPSYGPFSRVQAYKVRIIFWSAGLCGVF